MSTHLLELFIMHLVQVTREIRILLKIFAALAIVGTLIFIVVQGGTIIKKVFYPTPPPPPEEKFGKLPQLPFTNSSPLEFRVNTVSGELPVFPDRTNAYEFAKPSANILALQNVRKKVEAVGFTAAETKVSGKDTVYQWFNPRLGMNIVYNLLTDNFTVNSDYLVNPSIIRGSSFPTEKEYLLNDVKDFLSSIRANTSDIDFSKSEVNWYRIDDSQQLTEITTNLSTAMIAKIKLHQADIAVDQFRVSGAQSTDPITSLPIVYNNPTDTNMMFTVARTKEGMKVVEAQFSHYVVDLNSSTTYPIKTSAQAFEDLQKGRAEVFYKGSNSTIDVTDVHLAFYLGKESPQYLQPIYIFTGKDNFIAYVQAISSSSITD